MSLADRRPYPGNPASHLFRELSATFQQDASSPEVDRLASELAAHVGAAGHTACIGLVREEAVRKFYGLVYVLQGYGVTLRQRRRKHGDGVFVFAEMAAPVVSEWEGARVAKSEVAREEVAA